MKDPYDVLGLDKNSTQEEIKEQYHKLAKAYHPDHNKSSKAEAKFKELQEAYEILKDKKYESNYVNPNDFKKPKSDEQDTNSGDTGDYLKDRYFFIFSFIVLILVFSLVIIFLSYPLVYNSIKNLTASYKHNIQLKDDQELYDKCLKRLTDCDRCTTKPRIIIYDKRIIHNNKDIQIVDEMANANDILKANKPVTLSIIKQYRTFPLSLILYKPNLTDSEYVHKQLLFCPKTNETVQIMILN